MYRKKNRQIQVEEVKISLEKLVPENHILRAIDKATDFNFIYEEVEGLYSDKGRPGINAPDDKRNRSERGISLVHWLLVDGTCATLLYFQEKLYSEVRRNQHL